MQVNVSDVALVFEGGGMRVSYTAPVVRLLLEAGLNFPLVCGISAGSSNTANYLSRDAKRAKESFVDFAGDPKFGGVGSFLRGKGLFNAEYIYQETGAPGQALPFDFATFQANPAQMRVGSFRMQDGKAVYWTKEDTPTIDDLMIRVRASSTMPMLMPRVELPDGSYVDGALGPSGGIPLDAAK